MRRHYRYVALVGYDRPIEHPLMVLRIHGSGEEVYVPAQGWQQADPVCRDWYVNIPITEEHALRLLPELAPAGPLEDPYPHALTRDAAEGYGTQWFYYAVETPRHPLDDPLTVVRLHYPSKHEESFTAKLLWEQVPVTGRKVRISKEDLDRLEEVLVRRAFGGAECQHYAIVSPYCPDVKRPAAIVRVGPEGEQRYVGDGEWVRSSAVFQIRNRFLLGTFVPLTEQEAARQVERWQPHPDISRVRYYAWMDDSGEPAAVVRTFDEDGCLSQESYRDGVWTGVVKSIYRREYSHEEGRVEIDLATAERLGKAMDRQGKPPEPVGDHYDYFAIVNSSSDDVSNAVALVRTHDGGRGEEKFNPRIDRWRSSITLYEIHTARDDHEDVPISTEVAARLRQILLDRFAARETERAPEVPSPLGKGNGIGKVTVPLVDEPVLAELRQIGDPLADAAIAEVYELGEVDRVNKLLTRLRRNGSKVPDGLPPLLRQYFAESARLPQWTDREALTTGQQLWDGFAPHLATLLWCCVLPVRYASAGTLRHTRRGMESVRLLQDVLTGGLVNPRGRALRTVQKIRLLQAATRYQEGGLVANQEDLAATLGMVSVFVPQRLARLYSRDGLGMTDAERADWVHIWRVVGHLMGIDDRLLPPTYDDTATLLAPIWRRDRASSAAGNDLMTALHQRFAAAVPRPQRPAFRELVGYLCEYDVTKLHGLDWVPWPEVSDVFATAARVPHSSLADGRDLMLVMSRVVGKSLLKADRQDLALPIRP